MNRIITIGREFGSGGRELGKLVAEKLGIAYYDGEIVAAIAKRSEMAEHYVEQVVEQRIMAYYPLTVGNTLSMINQDFSVNQSIYTAQTEIIQEMAQKSDCVIVGRCADHILAEMHPLRIFVYADMAARVARCRARGEKGNGGQTDRELEKRIHAVDKSRAQYYRLYTGQEWAARGNYDLCVNTSSMPIAKLADVVAAFATVE